MASTNTPAAVPSPEPIMGRLLPSREQALADQRLRLTLAMIDAVGHSGYRATTVADVIVAAGASRKTFYKHFADKQECFLAAYDLVSAYVIGQVERAYRDTESWPERLEAAIEVLRPIVATENPAALRLSTLEVGAPGRWRSSFASSRSRAISNSSPTRPSSHQAKAGSPRQSRGDGGRLQQGPMPTGVTGTACEFGRGRSLSW